MNKLEIKGFKCFINARIPLSMLTVLAGGNSVGKSSVIQALLLIRSNLELGPSIPLNGNFLLNLGNSTQVLSKRSDSDEIIIDYSWNGQNYGQSWNIDIGKPEVFLKPSIRERRYSDVLIPITSNNFHYLHAERLGPRPLYEIGIRDRNVGWQGENTVAVLSSEAVEKPDYNVATEKSFPKSTNPKLRNQVDLWMNYLIPGIDVSPKRISEVNQSYVFYNDNSPYNVGFGISYVLPIIVSGLIAKQGEMLIVENPEAHLHPSGQSRIGEFLTRVASSGVQVIIETHSEHVINGIRLASLKRQIAHQDVMINFFSKVEGVDQPNIDSIQLNENADLEKWPVGFFDQQQEDIATIFKLRKANRQ